MQKVDNLTGWKHVSPKPVYLIVTKDKKGKTNIMTACWAMQTSYAPPLAAVSIAKNRHTYDILRKTKEFVFAVPSVSMKKEALFCGTVSGKKGDKIKELGMKTKPAKHVKPPLLSGCVVNMECKAIKEIELGDHVLFVGKILATYVSKKHKKILFDAPPRKMGSFEFTLRYHLKQLKELE